MVEKYTMDHLLISLGAPGKAQVLLFLLLCTNAFPITFNFLYITFFANTPPYHCKIPTNTNYTVDDYIPKNQQCIMYKDPANHENGTESCQNGYDYDFVGMEKTIASEWDLVCEDGFWVSLASTIFFVGVMIGGLIFGVIADKVGRRYVVLGTLYGQAILGVIISFSVNYPMFVVFKLFQGMLIQGLQAANYSLVMELFPLKYRTMAGMFLAMCATSGHMFMALMLYFIHEWRQMQLLISLLPIVTIFYSWLFPESLRWLLSLDRQERAKKQAARIACLNRVPLPADISEKLAEISRDIHATSASNAGTHYDCRDLFRTPVMRKYSACLMFAWFAASLSYYGIQFYIPKMPGKQYRYLNLFISGATETAARVVGYFIIDRIGRRKPLIVFYILSGILCIAPGVMAYSIPCNGDSCPGVVIANILAIIGKLCSAQCFAFMLIYSSEIFPTVIRTVGLGATASCTRIGAIVASQIWELKKVSSIIVPFLILGTVSIASSILIMLLPETKDCQLPNTVEDVETIANVNADSSASNVQVNGVYNISLIETPQSNRKSENNEENATAPAKETHIDTNKT